MSKYQNLVGKSKQDVIRELGDEFNYFPACVWTYKLKTGFIFKKKLFIYFQEEEVKKIKIKTFL